MYSLSKKLIVELIGTFALILFGAGSGAISGLGSTLPTMTSIALAHGLVVMACAYAFGHISGVHLNPAVTVGLWVAKKIPTTDALAYIVTQIIGSIVAGFTLAFVFADAGPGAASLGAVGIVPGVSVIGALLLEGICVFLLVSVVLQTAVAGKAGQLAPLAIGMTLAASIMFLGPITGAAINPVRAIGPAVANGDMQWILPYCVATVLGGVVAGLLYTYVLSDEK